MNTRKIRRTALIVLVCAVGVWLGAAYLLPVLLPFLIGLLAAWIAEKPVQFLTRKLHFPRWLASFLCVLLLLAALAAVLFFLCRTVCSELMGFLRQLPQLMGTLAEPLEKLEQRLFVFAEKLPDGLGKGVRAGLTQLFAGSSGIGTKIYTALFDFASGVLGKTPSILLFLVTTLLAVFMSSAEMPVIRAEVKKRLPQPWVEKLSALSGRLKDTLGGWLRAQLQLMGITMMVLTAGLMLLRTEYPLLFALVITLVDALPVFGTGIVLVPWSLLSFLQGDNRLGFGFLILYGAALLTRQILEPRLVGRHLGLHPLVTLMALYIGFRCIGILGMILFPIGTILLKQLLPLPGNSAESA